MYNISIIYVYLYLYPNLLNCVILISVSSYYYDIVSIYIMKFMYILVYTSCFYNVYVTVNLYNQVICILPDFFR